MNPLPPSGPPPAPASTPPIRQVGILMLVLSLAVPVGLYFGQAVRRPLVDAHRPERLEQALSSVAQAIRPRPAQPITVTADDLRRDLAACAGSFDKSARHDAFDEMANHLTGIDRRLQDISGAASKTGNRLLAQVYRLDVARWRDDVNAALTARRIGCDDIRQSLRLMDGPRGEKILAEARWQEHARKGTTIKERSATNTTESSFVRFSPTALQQADPWQGWPGCIWLSAADGKRAWYVAHAEASRWGHALCDQEGIRPAGAIKVAAAVAAENRSPTRGDDAGWFVPDSLPALLADLDRIRLPSGIFYENFVNARLAQGGAAGNRRHIGRAEVDVGFNIHLTLDPATQGKAQQIARCYTGDTEACRWAGLDAKTIGQANVFDKTTGKHFALPGARDMWEQAAARMVAVVVLDVASGRIEALASAHSDCYRQEYDGPGRDARCPSLWTRPYRKPDALLNHAVFDDYWPGSTVKPIMAASFLKNGGTAVETLQHEIAVSDSKAFLRRMFCLDTAKSASGKGKIGREKVDTSARCEQTASIQDHAARLGWNLGCTDKFSADCGRIDVLFGRPAYRRLTDSEGAAPGSEPLSRNVLFGRFLAEPDRAKPPVGSRLWSRLDVAPERMRSCAASSWDRGARACEGLGEAGLLINEGYGQGEARATALGVAGMVARLAAAGNGREQIPWPHLVERIADAQGNSVATAATSTSTTGPVKGTVPLTAEQSIGITTTVARQVLAGMRMGSRVGTSRAACESVFGKPACEKGIATFAGKTGTTSFPFDNATLDYIRRNECTDKHWSEACNYRPIKWYVAAFDSKGVSGSAASEPAYDKVIAVLTERNWYGPRSTYPNRVHGLAADGQVNVAAEIGMRVIAKGDTTASIRP